MRLQLFVLPAVLIYVATARVIHHPEPRQHQYVSDLPSEAHLTEDSPGIHARFYNSSSTPEATLQSSTLSPSPKPSLLPLKAAQTASENGQSQSAIPTSGQVGSVPAFGSGPGAATTEESKSSTPTTKPYLSAIPQSHQKDTVAQTEAATSTQSSKQVSPSAAASSVPAHSTSAKGSAVGAGSQQPTAPASNSSSSASGNTAMALGFNSIWASMGESSPCDANDKNQVVACIKGQYAHCSGGKYTMIPCPQGQQCFALPLSKDFKGVTVQCASLQEANQKLGQSSVAPTASAAATPTHSPTQSPTHSPTHSPMQSPTQSPAQSASVTPQQISDGKPTAISTTTTSAAGSAKASPPAQQPTAVQSAKPTTTEVGTLPTVTSTEPTSTITTKEPTSTNATPSSPAAGSTTTDDIIIITPIPDSDSARR